LRNGGGIDKPWGLECGESHDFSSTKEIKLRSDGCFSNDVFGDARLRQRADRLAERLGAKCPDAKKEGKLVAGIPARAELRKQLESVFEPKFGVEMELMTARGPQNASRIAAEYQAGVRTSAS
jgi:hypothetical protein